MFKGTHFGSEVKSIVFNVWSFFDKVRNGSESCIINWDCSDKEIKELVAKVTGVGVRSRYSIIKEGMLLIAELPDLLTEPLAPIATISYKPDFVTNVLQENVPPKRKMFPAPKIRGPKCKSKLDLIDDFSKCAIRRILYNFNVTEKQSFSVADVNVKIKEDLNIDVSDNTMRKLIKSLGFRWRKTKDNREILMEKE